MASLVSLLLTMILYGIYQSLLAIPAALVGVPVAWIGVFILFVIGLTITFFLVARK